MRVNRFILPSFAILALLLTVWIAQVTGQWITSGKQLVDVENLTSTEDIRGWMTLQQVADGFGLDVAELYELLSIPEQTPPSTALKEMEGVVPDFEVTVVRDLLTAHLGGASAAAGAEPDLATTASEDSALDQAVAPTATLSTQPTATPETAPAAPSGHTPQADGLGAGATALPEGQLLPAAEIKGKQTLQEIAEQTQVSVTALIEALQLPPETDVTTAVRDLVEQGKISEIDAVRAVVAELQAH